MADDADTVFGNDDSGTQGPRRIGRRELVLGAAAAGAGLAAGALVDGGAADAASGGDLILGKSNTANATTSVSTKTGVGLSATSSAKDQAGIKGSNTSAGGGNGVHGVSSHGIGVQGSSTADGQSGVQGVDTSGGGGIGVDGTSNHGTGVAGSTGSTAADAVGVKGTITSKTPGGSSAGVLGVNNGTGGAGIGVSGSHAGAGYGVYGFAPSGAGVNGSSDDGAGVQGLSNSGAGVYGGSSSGPGVQAYSPTSNALLAVSDSGDSVRGESTSGYGVYGTSTSNIGVVGQSSTSDAVYGQTSKDTKSGILGSQTAASGDYAVYGFGNIAATGTKSAVVPASDGGDHLTLYCVESPDCWFEDFGSGRLSSGSVSIPIEAVFGQTIETGNYHVFLQPEGECNGLIVLDKTETGFTVQEPGGGKSDIAFSYRITARRKNVSAPRLKRVRLPTPVLPIREGGAG